MTLFENIGAILVGLILLSLAAWGLTTAFDAMKLSETEQGLTMIRMQTQHLFNGTDYTGLDNDVAISAGIAPATFLKGNRLINSWGGDVTLAPITDEASFSIELTLVPRSECTKLARFQSSAWRGIEANGTDVTEGTVADVANACTSSQNTLLFTSR